MCSHSHGMPRPGAAVADGIVCMAARAAAGVQISLNVSDAPPNVQWSAFLLEFPVGGSGLTSKVKREGSSGKLGRLSPHGARAPPLSGRDHGESAGQQGSSSMSQCCEDVCVAHLTEASARCPRGVCRETTPLSSASNPNEHLMQQKTTRCIHQKFHAANLPIGRFCRARSEP